jgi:hypothetical protein
MFHPGGPRHQLDFPRFAGLRWSFGVLAVDHLSVWVAEPRSGEAGTGFAESAVLEVQRREHPERGVSADAVVERFDVFEDLAGELAAVGPGVAVDEFLLEGGEEALGDGVDASMSSGGGVLGVGEVGE